jgi:AcrR family transcriptional regulator
MAEQPARRRRTQSERREATQAAVLDTALEILATEGYVAFASSGVAARAGISRGALEHYYPRKIDLIAAACHHAIERSVAEAREAAASPDMAGDPVGTFLSASERFFFAPAYAAQIELLIAARADSALAGVIHPIVLDARRRLDDVWTEVLIRLGQEAAVARRYVDLSHVLMRGLYLAETWLPQGDEREKIIAQWRDASRALLASGL